MSINYANSFIMLVAFVFVSFRTCSTFAIGFQTSPPGYYMGKKDPVDEEKLKNGRRFILPSLIANVNHNIVESKGVKHDKATATVVKRFSPGEGLGQNEINFRQFLESIPMEGSSYALENTNWGGYNKRWGEDEDQIQELTVDLSFPLNREQRQKEVALSQDNGRQQPGEYIEVAWLSVEILEKLNKVKGLVENLEKCSMGGEDYNVLSREMPLTSKSKQMKRFRPIMAGKRSNFGMSAVDWDLEEAYTILTPQSSQSSEEKSLTSNQQSRHNNSGITFLYEVLDGVNDILEELQQLST